MSGLTRVGHVSEFSDQKPWASHSDSKSDADFTSFPMFTWKASLKLAGMEKLSHSEKWLEEHQEHV